MGLPAKKTDGFYTYADYLTWDDDKRREIIEGKVYAMVPAPSRSHQDIAGQIYRLLSDFLENRECEVYIAPFDVILSDAKDKDSKNIVQPDVFVICDEEKSSEKGFFGAPDICIEVISPSTGARDMKEKLNLYEKFGVKEYWLVHPEVRTVTIYKLEESGHQYGRPDVFVEEDIFEDKLLKGLKIDLSKVFKKPKETS